MQTNSKYAEAMPFPHAVIDGHFSPELVRMAELEFPSQNAKCWKWFKNGQEHKAMCSDPALMGTATASLLRYFFSPGFLTHISLMTGIRGLEPNLLGGGMHLIPRFGKMGMRVDFNRGPKGYRRLNATLFLNSSWEETWGGHLELASAGGKERTRIAPIANRLVVFSTSETSFYGHQEPLLCPPERARKSLEVHYYTQAPETLDAPEHSTKFVEFAVE